MSRRALIIHHDANSLCGLLGEHLRNRRFELDERWITPPGEPDHPGDFARIGTLDPHHPPDLLVILGSGSSLYDPGVAHWVEPELDLLRAADAAAIPTLGICFGHQMLAAAHGGKVEATPHPEIGWRTVVPIPGAPVFAGPWFQWHLDHATAPPGAQDWASSQGGLQAFRLRSNIGVQFHPELNEAVLSAWVDADRQWLTEHRHDPEALLEQTSNQCKTTRGRAFEQFDLFLGELGLLGDPPI